MVEAWWLGGGRWRLPTGVRWRWGGGGNTEISPQKNNININVFWAKICLSDTDRKRHHRMFCNSFTEGNNKLNPTERPSGAVSAHIYLHFWKQLTWVSFESTCFSLLISHPSQQLTASPRPPLTSVSADKMDESPPAPSLLSSTHTPFSPLSYNPIFSSVISLGPWWWSNDSPVGMGSVFRSGETQNGEWFCLNTVLGICRIAGIKTQT